MTNLSPTPIPVIRKNPFNPPPTIQGRLFDLDHIPPITLEPNTGGTITDRFNKFHAQNPHVYNLLRDMALSMKRAGVNRHGIKGLFEVLRWRYAIQTHGRDYKLNNNFTAEYSRKLMDENPELNGFFETRVRRADKWSNDLHV